MKIRTALTLKNTCVTATIFLLCMVLIYLVSEHTRDQTFFRNLKSEGITKANLFLAEQVDYPNHGVQLLAQDGNHLAWYMRLRQQAHCLLVIH